MPYKSDAQRRFMHARHPEIAAKWDAEIRAKKRVKKNAEVFKAAKYNREFQQGTKQRMKRAKQAQAAGFGTAVGGTALGFKGLDRQTEGKQMLKQAMTIKHYGHPSSAYLPVAAKAGKTYRAGVRMTKIGNAAAVGGLGAIVGAPVGVLAAQVHAKHKYDREHGIKKNATIFKAMGQQPKQPQKTTAKLPLGANNPLLNMAKGKLTPITPAVPKIASSTPNPSQSLMNNKVAKSKGLMSDAEIKRRKKLQGHISVTTSTLGLTALGLKGVSAAAPRIARLGAKGAQIGARADKAATNTLIASGGIGGVGGYNFASYTNAESRKRKMTPKLTPVKPRRSTR